MSKQSRRFYSFGAFKYFPEDHILLYNGRNVRLSGQTMDMFEFLFKHRNKTITKEALLSEIWPEGGEERNLQRCISTLRARLEDFDSNQYIETRRGEGYRFVAEVTRSLEEDGDTDKHRIAVLPFKISMETGNIIDDPLGLAIADTLITKLGQIRSLLVRPTSSIEKYLGSDQDLQAVGHDLQVDFILEGHVQRANDRILVNVQLVRMDSNDVSWAEAFNERFDDILALQNMIAEQVANALTLRLSGEELALMTKHPTENINALLLYGRGRLYWNKLTPQDLNRAIGLFEEAIALDDNYARAYAGLADSYTLLAWFGNRPPMDVRPLVEATAIKAMTIDPNLAEAYTSLATFQEGYEWNWNKAEKNYRRAIELNPNYHIGHQAYADYLARLGRFHEAQEHYDEALKIKADASFTHAMKAWAYVFANQPERALKHGRIALECQENYFFAYLVIGEAYEQQEKFDEAASMMLKAVEHSSGHSFAMTWLAIAYALSDRKPAARKILNDLKERSEQQYVPPYFMGLIYAVSGENKRAFELLEKAYEVRDSYLGYLRVDYYVKDLRADARYESLLRRIGLSL
jgi:TolB-like protein/Tfp pilus assembly protein PilF